MPEIQNQDTPQNVAENGVDSPATENPAVAPAPAAEPKPERLVESNLEASHSEVLPLSPIETADAAENAPRENANGQNKHRGLRRGNAGRNNRRGNTAEKSVGVVENPQDVKETLSGKFVDGYDKDKDFRRARERRENAEKSAAQAQGWRLSESDIDPSRRHPQSNTGANRGKLIIEPAPIPEQEKDPSFWQKFKAKILSIFGLNKKKNKKNRRGGKYRNKHGKKFYNGKDGEGRPNGFKKDFRGGNRRNRHFRGNRGGNSGARPQQNGNGGSTPPAA